MSLAALAAAASAAALLLSGAASATDVKTQAGAGPGAEVAPGITRERLEQAVAAAWKGLPPDLAARVVQDETMALCSQYRNQPPQAVADAILAREKKNVTYPADGKYLGSWKNGEKLALSGFGGRMGDDPKRANGGNCYACHQLAPTEISYGTLGPSLLAYGKLKGNTPEAQKEVYERVFNAQAVFACSNMPRFGHNKFLTIEQIKDAVAFLLDPESPVNK
ncbi:sulfur-oxidizing protein SoxX [Rhodoplanes tepidamans]|uniref:Sulfur oxidation c-type cytochrome SoxX n=2 Tax=Nitrobacteraceae TaxID=41294 RepID=A0ABT5JK26_RHOTP|nr:sulfur oxidation c-type cytochrome SoxX [Rhodoplanes tepidamans]MDC7789947.1 sulfur oxidation c-type cytochrome SoxX [Rhodoplanes tepidamans]MDQ0357748.1 sulfur-oxidizing protein SoxX [Rhodoplanes tepidamans]